MDQLFLLPARVLAMDSLSFREDVASVAPDFFSSHHLKNSPPHNSLDSTDSNRSSVRVLEDTEGLVFARASNGCLWLCKFCLLHCILFVFIFILCVHKVWICILKNGTSTHQLLIKIHTRYIQRKRFFGGQKLRTSICRIFKSSPRNGTLLSSTHICRKDYMTLCMERKNKEFCSIKFAKKTSLKMNFKPKSTSLRLWLT